jgi:hypothetical protein
MHKHETNEDVVDGGNSGQENGRMKARPNGDQGEGPLRTYIH